jgi:hypothetical protein
MFGSRLITTLLIAMWLLTPDILCLLPGGVELTMEEHECCEKMGEQCGMMPMPEIHKCCQTVRRSDAVIASKTTDYPELRVATAPFIIPDRDLTYVVEHPLHWLRFEHPTSPPLVAPHSIAILRI